MKILSPILILALGLNAVAASGGTAKETFARSSGELVPQTLRCESRVNPLAVAPTTPQLSWELQPRHVKTFGLKQSAWQILVASSPKKLAANQGDLWASGKMKSDDTVYIRYAGRPLASRETCHWKVRVWDQDGKASAWSAPADWTMGLLAPSDWQAQWIGDATPPPPDSPAHNGFRSQNAVQADASKWVVVDLQQAREIDSVALFGARPYNLIPPDAPGYLFPIRFRILTALTADYADAKVVCDRTQTDVFNPGWGPLVCRFPPAQARYVKLEVTQLQPSGPTEYGFALAEMEVRRQQVNLAGGCPVRASDTLEQDSWSLQHLCDGDRHWHPAGPAQALPQPLLRREFQVKGAVAKAVVRVSALGFYELRLNGKRVGDQLLQPEFTEYPRHVQYQTYDVTPLLQTGTNALGALLGDGYYAGRIGMSQVFAGRLRGIYGRTPHLLMQLELTYRDGRREVIATDGQWKSTLNGPIRSSDIYDGETYDFTREQVGWDRAGFDDRIWQPAAVAAPVTPQLTVPGKPPIRVYREIPATSITSPARNLHVVDFGQHFAGWSRMRLAGLRGATVLLRHGEALNPDGTVYFGSLRGALQTDTVILDGNPKGRIFEPHFTTHGFRYVQIEGLTEPPREAVGRAYGSDVETTAHFECSQPLFNRLWQAVWWTLRSNLMGIPTDTCQRDERLPWVAMYPNALEFSLLDLGAFANACYAELQALQAPDGTFPMQAPNPLRFTAPMPGNGDVGGIWSPWEHYLATGDRDSLRRHFPAARLWGDHLEKKYPQRFTEEYSFGDWLNADMMTLEGWSKRGSEVPQGAVSSAVLAHSADILSRMATALGEEAEARRFQKLFQEFRGGFQKRYLNAEGKIEGDTQAGYALALNYSLTPDPERALQHLLRRIKEQDYRTTAGNLGAHLVLLELSRGGEHATAIRLASQRKCPSWGFMMDQGATTIWERWDTYVPDRKPGPRAIWQQNQPWQTYIAPGPFSDPSMDSHNHRGFTQVGQWLLNEVLGISTDESAPGGKHFLIAPKTHGLTWAKGNLRTPRGLIACEWKAKNGKFTLDVSVPPNTTATVLVPANDPKTVSVSGPSDCRSAVVPVGHQGTSKASFELSSGNWQIQVPHALY